LVQAGVDLPTVQKISGHKTLAMVGRYSHANGAHIDAAMDKLEQRMSRKPAVQSDSPLDTITPEYTRRRIGKNGAGDGVELKNKSSIYQSVVLETVKSDTVQYTVNPKSLPGSIPDDGWIFDLSAPYSGE
jgi:hypothetical protein